MSDQNESEANVPAADVPAPGNSADFFSESNVASESAQPNSTFKSKSKKFTWPIAAVAATALVAGLGGYAIGHNGGFDGRPVGSVERYGMHQPGGGPQGGMQGHGMKGNDIPGFGTQGRMGPNDGPLDGRTPHCHDASGQDQAVGADGKCADGSVPIQSQLRDGTHGGYQMNPSATPSATTSPS